MLTLFKKQKVSKLFKVIETGDLATLAKRLQNIDSTVLNDQTDQQLSAIETAILAQQPKALVMLIEAGANIEQRSSTDEPYLLVALKQVQSLTLINALLQSGASTEYKAQDENTHLIAACFKHCSVTELMLHLSRFNEYGIDLNQEDSQGLNALSYALETQNKELLNFLIASGVQTPEQWPQSLPEELKQHVKRAVDDLRIRQMFLNQ
ncbi:ankyrin repeat domain-containing protein [Neptunomonas japonica]|uniref:ankyrin repeat domain-containing protein n=1 Tax=Neptunomonas japonica TaxID=417574 RepID=UPI00041CF602|nr:ankyrin repeat domain-containing protein [Neptunomonas japonica]